MKKILLLILFLLFSQNLIYSQNEETNNKVFEYCLDKIGDLNALIYLFKSEFKDEFISLEKLESFAQEKDYNISFNNFGKLSVNEDSDHNLTIHFSIISENNDIIINDTISAEKISCLILLSAPVSEGSSIRSANGRIINGIIYIRNSEKTEINDYDYTGMVMMRVDISEIKRLKLKLENNYELGTPEWVFQEYQNKLAEGNYDLLVRLISNEDLDSFKSLFDEVILMDTTNQLLPTLFPQISNQKEFLDLSSKGFMASFFNSLFRLNPQLVESLINVKVKIVGKVFESNDLVHIVTRNSRRMGEDNLSIVEVKSLIKLNDNWYMTLQDKIVQMGYKLKNNMLNR